MWQTITHHNTVAFEQETAQHLFVSRLMSYSGLQHTEAVRRSRVLKTQSQLGNQINIKHLPHIIAHEAQPRWTIFLSLLMPYPLLLP